MPTDKLGKVVEEREQNCSQREQYDDGPLGQCRNPEGQMLIEEAPPKTLVLVGISRDAEIDLSRSRELTSLLEKTLFAVNLACGIHQQVDERGVETIAGCQHLFGANQVDFLLRNVVRQVDHAGRQCQSGDKIEPTTIGVSLAVAQEIQSWIVKRSPDGRVLRSIDKDRCVYLARSQCEQCSTVAQRLHRRIVACEAVKREHGFAQ